MMILIQSQVSSEKVEDAETPKCPHLPGRVRFTHLRLSSWHCSLNSWMLTIACSAFSNGTSVPAERTPWWDSGQRPQERILPGLGNLPGVFSCSPETSLPPTFQWSWFLKPRLVWFKNGKYWRFVALWPSSTMMLSWSTITSTLPLSLSRGNTVLLILHPNSFL